MFSEKPRECPRVRAFCKGLINPLPPTDTSTEPIYRLNAAGKLGGNTEVVNVPTQNPAHVCSRRKSLASSLVFLSLPGLRKRNLWGAEYTSEHAGEHNAFDHFLGALEFRPERIPLISLCSPCGMVTRSSAALGTSIRVQRDSRSVNWRLGRWRSAAERRIIGGHEAASHDQPSRPKSSTRSCADSSPRRCGRSSVST